jgi:hypothetical protein
MESKAPFVESLSTHRRRGARVDGHGFRRFEGFASDHFEFGDVRDIFNRDRVAGVSPEEARAPYRGRLKGVGGSLMTNPRAMAANESAPTKRRRTGKRAARMSIGLKWLR